MKRNRRITGLLMALLLALSMLSGCGFSVGSNSGASDEAYAELFPDRSEKLGSAYKTSFVEYKFKVDEYGEILLAVDTSDGDSFEMDEENAGFLLKNSKDKETLHAYAISLDVFQQAVADLDDLVKINDRKFFYHHDEEHDISHLYTYLADCGMDCGMVLEAYGDEAVFELLAFRGEALDGSHSNPKRYKAEATGEEVASGSPESTAASSIEEEPDKEEPVEEVVAASPEEEKGSESGTAEPGSMRVSTLSPEAEEALASLDSDYSKVNWGVTYPVDEETPGLVISVTLYAFYDWVGVVIGITNLYGQALTVSGQAIPLDKDGNEIGESYIYVEALGSGNTYIRTIPCDGGIPNGQIRWKDLTFKESEGVEFAPWECDYTLRGEDNNQTFYADCSFFINENKPYEISSCTVLLLDAEGNVVGIGEDYITDKIEAGQKMEDSIWLFADPDDISRFKDLAIFCNTTIAKEE